MATRQTVSVVEDGDGRRPDYAGKYHNATYHGDGTVTITIPENPTKELHNAIENASTLEELKDALVGSLTDAEVPEKAKGRR